jgi:Ca-activated chloride channel family protein
VHDLHPQIPGDVFAGTQLSVLGRFDKPGKHQLLLEGNVNGEKRAYEYTINLVEKDSGKAYLPRMWAVRRVGFLMDQISMKGFSQELKDEIVRLGTKFGIVTPYTSFLIVEDETRPMPRPGAPMPEDSNRGGRAAGDGERGATGGGMPAAPSEHKGGKAVEDSKKNADRREAQTGADAEEVEKDAADDMAERAKLKGFGSRSDTRLRKMKEEGWGDKEAEKLAAQIVKTVGTRSFIWDDGLWLEADLTNGELFGAEVVDYLSDRYFELAEDAKVAKILALGQEVIFRHGKTTIRIVGDKDTTEGGDNEGDSKEG